MPFTCVAALFLLQYHLYVHLSSRFVSALQLKMMIGNISVKISTGFPPCRHRRWLRVLHYTQMAVGCQQHVPAALSRGKSACTHCRGGWLGPRVGLHGMNLRKLLPRTGLETRTVPTVAIRCNTLPRPRMRSPLGLTCLFSEHFARPST